MANQYKELIENHLKKKKRELLELDIEHKINNSVYEAKYRALADDIHAIEVKLETLQKK